jgi:hypothetical protein
VDKEKKVINIYVYVHIYIHMYIHIPEYYLVIKKNGIMSSVGKWMELEIIMLNLMNQAQKAKYCMFHSFVDPRPKMMMGCDYQREMVWRGRNSNRELGVKERILKGDED